MKNYWKMGGLSPFSASYAYVDHSSFLADQLFVQNEVTVKFKGEMVKEDSPYCMVFCKVKKKDSIRFEDALEKLKDKMLLMGYSDYPEVCNEFEKMIDEGLKAKEK